MKTDPTGKSSKARNEAMARDFAAGHTMAWLAFTYGVSRQRVHQILKKTWRENDPMIWQHDEDGWD
jgi:Mor family transcriptional regulator